MTTINVVLSAYEHYDKSTQIISILAYIMHLRNDTEMIKKFQNRLEVRRKKPATGNPKRTIWNRKNPAEENAEMRSLVRNVENNNLEKFCTDPIVNVAAQKCVSVAQGTNMKRKED